MTRLVVSVSGTAGSTALPPHPPHTSIDGNGNLLVDGVPTFVLSVSKSDYANLTNTQTGYTEAQANVKYTELVANGFNVIGWQNWFGHAPYVDEQDAMIKQFGLASVGNSGHRDVGGVNCGPTDNVCIRSIVNKYKGRPELWTWQYFGEFNPQSVVASEALAAYASIRAADPSRLITEITPGGTNPGAIAYRGVPGYLDATVMEMADATAVGLNHVFDEMRDGPDPGNDGTLGWRPLGTTFVPAFSLTPWPELTGRGIGTASGGDATHHTNWLRLLWLWVICNTKWIDILWGPNARQKIPTQNLTAASAVTFQSDGTDARQGRLTGLMGGVSTTELITLNNTSVVPSANTYDSGGFGCFSIDPTGSSRTVTVKQQAGDNHTIGTVSAPAGFEAGVFAPGDAGLPYGLATDYSFVLGVCANIRSIDQVILSPGPWIPCTTNHQSSYSGGFYNRGIKVGRKTYQGNTYVIACNIDSGASGSFTDTAINGVTIDVGQTINNATRLFGTGSGSTSFSGSVITEDFPAAATRIWRIT